MQKNRIYHIAHGKGIRAVDWRYMNSMMDTRETEVVHWPKRRQRINAHPRHSGIFAYNRKIYTGTASPLVVRKVGFLRRWIGTVMYERQNSRRVTLAKEDRAAPSFIWYDNVASCVKCKHYFFHTFSAMWLIYITFMLILIGNERIFNPFKQYLLEEIDSTQCSIW